MKDEDDDMKKWKADASLTFNHFPILIFHLSSLIFHFSFTA